MKRRSIHEGQPGNDSPGLRCLKEGFPAASLLLLLGSFVFSAFLFGNRVLLYKDVGADSINDTFPYFVHLSDYIRLNGMPSWSFCVGMGQDLFYLIGYLVFDPVVWLSRNAIPEALVFQHLAKTVVAGLAFMGFLRLRGLTVYASLAGSVFLSFSAYMCMGSCWNVLEDEVICFGILLFAAEKAIRDGRWLYVPLAIALVSLVTVFHLYLAALLLCLYVPARLFEIHGWRPFLLGRMCGVLAAAACLGIGLAGVTCLNNAASILNSPRGSGTIGNFWHTPVLFEVASLSHLMTAVLRAFSNDIIGTGNDFKGWSNYLEAPLNYCGLLCLLIFPQVFIGATRRQRLLYGLLPVFIVIPTALPWFRYLFWLFHGGYYRAFSLFSILGVITLSMVAFSRYTERRLNFWVLGATLVGLVSVLFVPFGGMQTVVNPEIRRLAIFFLLLYAALLTAGYLLKREVIFAWIIVGLTAVELVYFDRITVNRPAVAKNELRERIGYNDETVDAMRDIKSSDNGFYRVTKTWGSGLAMYPSLNDALVFGYYSTPSYSSFNSLNYIKFLIAVDAISREDDLPKKSTWSTGLHGHPLLSIFACEKYALTKEPVPFQTADQYELVRRYDDIYLFRNRQFLPLGLVFDRYLREDVFLQLPGWAKPQALLHAVVLSDSAANDAKLPQLTLDELKGQLRETTISESIVKSRENALDLRSHSQTRLDGTLRLDHKGVLVFQTPFDRGWHALVDGRKSVPIKVDAGLLGVVVEKGQHDVALHYRPPFLYTGAFLSIISCVIFAFALWRFPRIALPR